MKQVLLSIFIFITLSQANAWEVDNFHCKYEPMTSSDAALDAEVNRRIAETLSEFNRNNSCDKEGILLALKGAIASAWSGNMETWSQENVDSKCLNKEKTIYKGFSIKDAFVLRAAGLNYVIQVNGVRIGADKLSHFMTEGFDYYMEFQNSNSMEKVLKIGRDEEEGGYGWDATGIKSYGDLAANYQGFLFWKQVLDGANPYLTCVDGHWKQARDFKWSDYVNPLFDESINCSEFKTSNMEAVVDRNVSALQTSLGKRPPVCPLNRDFCNNVSSVITDDYIRSQIVHPRCLDPNTAPTEAPKRQRRPRAVYGSPGAQQNNSQGDSNGVN